MKLTIRAPTRARPLGLFVHMGLVILSALLLLMAGCETWRFPGMTPMPARTASASSPVLTIAPALLTPIPTYTASPPASASVASPTPTFGLPLPVPVCSATPMWGLGTVWNNESVRSRLGCSQGDQRGVEGEEVYFQHGHMLWRPDENLIYVLFAMDKPGEWGAIIDSFQSGEPDVDLQLVAPTATNGEIYVQPTGRFGKLWCENGWLRERLGWAIKDSTQTNATSVLHFTGAVQDFERGTLFWNGRLCFVLRIDDMSWTMY